METENLIMQDLQTAANAHEASVVGASQTIRICEWARSTRHNLSAQQRRVISQAVEQWRLSNRLNAVPLYFTEADGSRLCARQFVGVVEVGDAAIEIYPKLDAALLSNNPTPSQPQINSVMRSLLWMLEVSDHRELAEADTASLEESPATFFDLFAYLLGKHLLRELESGVAHTYVRIEDSLRMVRGRINLVEQVTRQWNRFDRIACAWDEFTADIPLNRLFKCACRFLTERVRHPEAVRLLHSCVAMLDEVDDVSAATAVHDVEYLRWDRSTERFRRPFELARRLLRGIGHVLGTGGADTYVFLLDMNRVFESYVHAVLEAHFKVGVATQEQLGTLFRIKPGGIVQKADYYWRIGGSTWIADAKYKHLAKGQHDALTFAAVMGEQFVNDDSAEPAEDESGVPDVQNGSGSESILAGRLLSPDDVRQLTVYSELAKRRSPVHSKPELMLLYPFIGSGRFHTDHAVTWNDTRFWLVPVRIMPPDLAGAIPPELPNSTMAQTGVI